MDILRASSTILTLFHKKVKYAIPTDNLKECKKYKKKGFLTIAERMGRKVEGFDFGNSPSKLMNENLAGKKIAMCTSNGTKSIIKCKKFNKDNKFGKKRNFLDRNIHAKREKSWKVMYKINPEISADMS